MNIKVLSKLLNISVNDIYALAHRYQNSSGIILFDKNESIRDRLIFNEYYSDIIKSNYDLIKPYVENTEVYKSKSIYLPITQKSYIYLLWRNGKLVYIGGSSCVLNRVHTHRSSKIFDEVSYIEVPKKLVYIIESCFISINKPEYNINYQYEELFKFLIKD